MRANLIGYEGKYIQNLYKIYVIIYVYMCYNIRGKKTYSVLRSRHTLFTGSIPQTVDSCHNGLAGDANCQCQSWMRLPDITGIQCHGYLTRAL
jgi:hypothetical protein